MDVQKRALVIGINAYGGGIPPLASAVRDAEAVARQLEQGHGYQVALLRDAGASASAILTTLAALVDGGLTAESSFVLYYAGHGIAADDAEHTGPKGFLLAHDADVKDQSTWLGMDALRGALDGLTARHLMLVLDCCYAGAFQWASTRSVGVAKRPLFKSQYERYRDGIAWQVLTSASYDELADDAAPVNPNRGIADGPDGHSPFAKALIEGLSGTAADSSRGEIRADGVITATELYQYIYERVAVNDRQTPGIFPLKPDNRGEFVFLAPGVELDLEPDPPLDDANNPWRGLDPYSPGERELFFGRDAALEELRARVENNRFVAVVGASGSGKSSLIRAGLLPLLDDPAWTVVESGRLAGDPVAQLHDAQHRLASSPTGERRLLVIDQFEDLFTECDEATRRTVVSGLDALVGAEGGPTVLIALRSDHERAAVGEFGDRWAAVRYLLPDVNRDGLRSMVLGPARAKAVFFEPAALVDTLVDDVAGMPGAVPLLSLTLADLYRQAQSRRRSTGAADRMISSDDYAAIGGVVGALHRRATDLYDAADAPGQDAIKRVFLRLVDQRPDGLVGRHVDLDELDFGPAHEAAVTSTLRTFTAARLLTVGGDDGRAYVEPAHDALVSNWDKLLGWLAQSGSQEVVRDASKAARDWSIEDSRSTRSKRLWNQDPRLAELRRRDQNQELNALEGEFVAASFRRLRRLARLRSVAITALAILTVIAVGAGVFARYQQSEAVQQAERASSRSLASDALNNATDEADLAALLALEAVRVANTPDARGSLAGVLSSPTRFLQRADVHDADISAIAFTDDGRIAATGDSAGRIRLWDIAESPFDAPQAIPIGDAIESDLIIRDLYVFVEEGVPAVLVFDAEGFLGFVDAATGTVDAVGPPGEFSSAVFSPDLQHFAGVNTDGVLRVYDIDQDLVFTEHPTVDVEPGDGVQHLAFSPDGTTLAWGRDTLFEVWRWDDGGAPTTSDVGEFVGAIAFSPDDDPSRALVAVGAETGTIYIVDRTDPALISPVSPSPVNQLFDLAFKPVGASDEFGGVTYTLASTHSNGDVNLFDVIPGDGAEPFGFFADTMIGHNDEALEVAFAPDGRIASGDFSGELVWWLDVAIPSLGFSRQDLVPAVWSDAAFAASDQLVWLDGDFTAWSSPRVLSDSAENTALVEDTRVFSIDAAGDVIAVGVEGGALVLDPDGTVVRELVAEDLLFAELVALSPDGRRLAAVSPGTPGRVAVWDVTTGAVSTEAALAEEFEPMSALFADDDVVWIGGRDRENLPTVLEIDTGTGSVLRELRHSSRFGNAVTALALSEDGRTLATGSMDRRISLWDADTLEPLPGGEFTGHRGNVTGIVFWDGGETLISSDDAGDVLVWDVSERRQFARLGGPTDGLRSLEVDTATATLLGTSEDGYVWTWSLDPREWRDLACLLAGRNMTQVEWDVYGDGGTRVRHCTAFPAEDGQVRDAEYGESLSD